MNRGFNYNSKSQISAFLKDHNLSLKKRWGQNFLVNRGAREKLVTLLEPDPGEWVWEIGPGMGAMTQLLLDHSVKLVAFEIDRGLLSFLEKEYGGRENFILLQGDVLKTWSGALTSYGPPAKILGNLPYSSASVIISSFIERKLKPRKMVFTVQKELAARITASPGQKQYSSFSVFCQYAFHTSQAGDLLPGSFYPVPEVLSTIIILEPAAREKKPVNEELFFSLVRSAFHSRRKTLRNNLLASRLAVTPGKEKIRAALNQCGLGDDIRGERLTVTEFIDLADRLEI